MDKIKSKSFKYSFFLALILTSSLVKSQDLATSQWIRDSMVCYDTLSLYEGGLGNQYFCETNSNYKFRYELKSDTLMLRLLKPDGTNDVGKWPELSEYWYKLGSDELLRMIYFEDLVSGYKSKSSGGEPFKRVRN